jgi:hypothetical protein
MKNPTVITVKELEVGRVSGKGVKKQTLPIGTLGEVIYWHENRDPDGVLRVLVDFGDDRMESVPIDSVKLQPE